MLIKVGFGVTLVGFLAGCSGQTADCLEGRPCSGPNQGSRDVAADGGVVAAAGEDGGGASAPACTIVGRSHVGLGGVELAAKEDAVANADRARAKPYSALVTEYARVLGDANAPTLLASTAGTFGQPNDRWYLEPIASGVFVETAYDVAFEGCLRMTGGIAGGSADPK